MNLRNIKIKIYC